MSREEVARGRFPDLTEIGGHLVQGDPDGAVGGGVVGVEGEELLAQQPEALLLPARLFLAVVFFFLRRLELDDNKRDV